MKPPEPPRLPGPPEQPSSDNWAQPPGQQKGMPVGAVIAFAGGLSPTDRNPPVSPTNLTHFDWKLCDGTGLSIDEYPDLFDTIGFIYGKDTTGKFLLPKYDGHFLRSVEPAGTTDPDRSKRKKPATGDGSPTGVGSTQSFALQDHTHKLAETQLTVAVGKGGLEVHTPAPMDTTQTGIVVTGKTKTSKSETRPVNTYIYWIIKCRP